MRPGQSLLGSGVLSGVPIPLPVFLHEYRYFKLYAPPRGPSLKNPPGVLLEQKCFCITEIWICILILKNLVQWQLPTVSQRASASPLSSPSLSSWKSTTRSMALTPWAMRYSALSVLAMTMWIHWLSMFTCCHPSTRITLRSWSSAFTNHTQ